MSLKTRVKKLEAKPKAKAAVFEMPAGDRETINDFLNVFMAGGEITDELQVRIDAFNKVNDCDLVAINEQLESEC